MTHQDVPQINQLSIFSSLPEVAQRFLQDRMHRADYPVGAMIVRAGMRCDYMAIVASGAIELRSVSGEVQLIDQGDIFGQAMMRYAVPSAFSVLTAMPTTLWVIGRSDWLAATYMAREETKREAHKVTQAEPKSFASNLAGLRKRSTPKRSTHEQRPSERASQGSPLLDALPNPSSQIRRLPFQIPWKILVALLVVGMMVVVVGPTFVGWADFTLVRLCLQARQPKLAESYLTLALGWRPDSAVLQDTLGYVRYLQVKPDQALEEFRRAVELQPDLASAQNNLGVALLARGRSNDALPHLLAAVNLDPGNATANVNLGNAYLATGNTTEAMQSYQDAFTFDPSQATAQAQWAILALKQGRVAEATRILQKATATDPKLALARQGLGLAALIENKPAAALPELEAARQLNPQDSATHLYLGLALKDLGRPMDATIEFIQVLSLSQDQAYSDLARENLQQVYDQLLPGRKLQDGNSHNGTSLDSTSRDGTFQDGTLPDELLQKGGGSFTNQ